MNLLQRILQSSAMIAVVLTTQHVAHAQSVPNYVVVERIGGDASFTGPGSAATSAATAAFLDTFQPLTASQLLPGFSYTLPTAQSGSSLSMTDSGTATSNGYFTRYANGQAYVITGYNTTVGTAGVAASNPATINRVIGTLTGSISYTGGGTLDSSTGFNDGVSNNYRSVATVDGSAFWVSTAGGIRYQTTPGSVTPTTAITAVNNRAVKIFGNSLFASSASGANVGVNIVGTAGTLPTSAIAPTLLPGTNWTGTSIYSFQFFDNPLNTNNFLGTGFDTLYAADDRSTTSGGILRYVFDGTNWVLTGTFNYVGSSNLNGARGLVATLDNSDPLNPLVRLWATGIGAAATPTSNDLFFLTDTLTGTSGTFGSAITLATSPTNTFFRGVELAAVPEPTTYALLGMTGVVCGVVVLYRRRRKQPKRFAPL